MNTTAFREGARVAAIILVLALAAILGSAVGNALNGRSAADAGAPAPGTAAEQSDWHDRHAGAAGIEPEQYLDYGQRHAAAPASRPTVTAPTPR